MLFFTDRCHRFTDNKFYSALSGMDLGSSITQLRKAQDISRDNLYREVGTSIAIIGRYEPGEMIPSVEMAEKIVGALEVSLDYLGLFFLYCKG
jgi:transcriptional regulator with XRE-family HTH domain